MAELADRLEPGQEVVFNTLFLDPYLWDLHVGRERLVQKARAAGAPLDGVTVSAGIPDKDDALALLDELAAAGIWLNAFKPGTVDQIRQVAGDRRRERRHHRRSPTSRAAPRAATTRGRTSTSCCWRPTTDLRSARERRACASVAASATPSAPATC